jgi:hypothetical protein
MERDGRRERREQRKRRNNAGEQDEEWWLGRNQPICLSMIVIEMPRARPLVALMTSRVRVSPTGDRF